MMELLRQRMVERRAALEAGTAGGSETAARMAELRETGGRLREEVCDGLQLEQVVLACGGLLRDSLSPDWPWLFPRLA